MNRNVTPWLFVLLHSPWYNSNTYHYMEGETMRVMFEKWIVAAKVDMVFAGHVHAYERSVSVSKFFSLDPTLQRTYRKRKLRVISSHAISCFSESDSESNLINCFSSRSQTCSTTSRMGSAFHNSTQRLLPTSLSAMVVTSKAWLESKSSCIYV